MQQPRKSIHLCAGKLAASIPRSSDFTAPENRSAPNFGKDLMMP
jgi:hypothetical protein